MCMIRVAMRGVQCTRAAMQGILAANGADSSASVHHDAKHPMGAQLKVPALDNMLIHTIYKNLHIISGVGWGGGWTGWGVAL